MSHQKPWPRLPKPAALLVLHVFMATASLLPMTSAEDPTAMASLATAAGRALAEIPSIQVDEDNATLTRTEFTLLIDSIGTRTEGFLDSVMDRCQEAVDTNDASCMWQASCPGLDQVFQNHATKDLVPVDRLGTVLPLAFQALMSDNCSHVAHVHGDDHQKGAPTTGEIWGYGLCFTSIVVVISNIGACLHPLMHKVFFQRLLQFLVAMGGGSLAATGLLVLIPEAFDIMAAKELGSGYIWKSTMAVMAIYLFFVLERLLKNFFYSRMEKKAGAKAKVKAKKSLDRDDSDVTSDADEALTHQNGLDLEEYHGHTHLPPGVDPTASKTVATLAWMVMAGDVIHNFVDGLAIGAAFSTNISVGISISLAVVCEELPHELADVAILLHSGVRMRYAILINFLSACVIYLGLVLGVLLGTSTQTASRWIFAFAGGLFLYVPLVDMMPEMSDHLDKEIAKGSKSGARIVAVLQVLGLIIGTLVIIMIVNVSQFIAV